MPFESRLLYLLIPGGLAFGQTSPPAAAPGGRAMSPEQLAAQAIQAETLAVVYCEIVETKN
jgi:hypothetical protein